MKFSSNLELIWRVWAKSLGEKAHQTRSLADKVALVRTVIFATYLITNCFIVAGVIRHWNEKEVKVNVEIYENQNRQENLYPEGWNRVGVGRNSRPEEVYYTSTIKNRTGEFE